MTLPRVTVLLTTYNAGRYVRDALTSIEAQTFTDFEVVVADDGSTDATRDLIREFPHLEAEVITGPRVGLPKNWQRALPHCRGEFLATIAGDDRWLPNNLEIGVRSLEQHPECALSYSRFGYIDELGDAVVPAVTAKTSRPPSGWVNPLQLLSWNFIGGLTMVMRRELIERVGGTDPDLLFMDLDLFVRIVREYPITYNDVVTAQYRKHDLGMSGDLEGMLAARLALYDKHLAGEPAATRRRMVSKARVGIAYRELWPAPTQSSVRAARRNLIRAIVTRPAVALHPLNVLMLISSLLGRVYIWAVRRFYPQFAGTKLKLRLQRVLGMAR